jgi:alpha-beta hydrolase superfamily lysophospholipase
VEWYYILLIVLAAILGLFLIAIVVVSAVVSKIIIHPKRYSRQEQSDYNHKQGFDKGTEVLTRMPLVFTMKDNYQIHGDVSLVGGSKKFCILLHGHATSREGALAYSLIFRQLGYSTVIYDERSHGDNVHKKVTMGVKEAEDLSEIVQQVYDRFGHDIHLGLQGVSMGASTALLALQYGIQVDFIVSDCAFAKLKYVIKDMLCRFHLPGALCLPFVELNLKVFGGFSFKDAEPVRFVKDTKVPILFIHGRVDTFIKEYNAEELYKNASGFKKLAVFPLANHGQSLYSNPEKYLATVTDFLKEIKED